MRQTIQFLSFRSLMTVILVLMPYSALADFYVSPTGDDSNSGSEAAPFATLTRAQLAVREIVAQGLKGDLRVVLREGTYPLVTPLTFTPDDSGTEAYSITYAAYPDESVLISGGVTLSNWKPIGNNRWTLAVPTVAEGLRGFRQLFVDGQRLTRGRFPNAPELMRVERVSDDLTEIVLDTSPPLQDFTGMNAELVMYQNWSVSRVGIDSSSDRSLEMKNPMGWVGHGPATSASPDKPTYIENALALVDIPGEWYLDETSGLLTYQAADGEDPNTRHFVLPVANALLQVTGTMDKPVRNLHFEGIQFAHTRWERPAFGYMGIQAGHYGTDMKAPTYVLPLALSFLYAEHCSITNATITHTGACAIGFGAGTRNNLVERCTLDDIGGNGIMVGWRGSGEMSPGPEGEDRYLSADWVHAEDVPDTNTISGNVIQRCGAIQHGAVGIFDAFARGTRITHNVIRDLPYSGISVGFRWNESETSQRDTLIAYNHVHDTMNMLADGGCLYTLGYQPGTIIRGNVFHDAHRSPFAHGGAPNNGIFFDQGSKGYMVENNSIYNTSGDSIRFNQTNADNMEWNNNHFSIGANPPD